MTLTLAEVMDPNTKDKCAKIIRKYHSKGYYFVVTQQDGLLNFVPQTPPHIAKPLNITDPKDTKKILELLKTSIDIGWEY
jgi:hypothetical protein